MSGQPARRRTLVLPREHGAWGILLVPLVTGAAVGLFRGGRAAPLVPFTIAALAVFWLRTPVESWVGTAPVRARTPSELRMVRRVAFGLASAAMAALVWLFWGGRNPGLVWIGAAAGAAFLLQAVVKGSRKRARLAGQIIGAAGLTAAAPAAFYATTGELNRTALALWTANLLFAANQIHYVQTRILAARAASPAERLSTGRGFLIGQVGLVVLLAAACALRFLSPWAALAFVPVLFRGFAWFAGPPQPLAIHALGRRELTQACLFGVLLIVGFVVRAAG